MRIVALDPGKNHFAYAVIHDDRCVETGHFDTITDLHHERVGDQIDRFRRDVEAVIQHDSPNDWLAVERMQHRPRLGGGAVTEYMNVMIGICLAVAHGRSLSIYPVLPSTWKTHTIRTQRVPDRKRFTMVGQKLTMRLPPGSKHKTRLEFCPGLLDRQPRARDLTPHEGDAIGIGCYVWERLTGRSIVAHVLT